MKTREGFMLREVAGNSVVISIGENRSKFNGMVSLNASGVLLWKRLEQGCTEDELVDALTAEYDVDTKTAAADVAAFLERMNSADLLCD